MQGTWILLVSIVCVTWAATFPSEEYSKPHTDTEMGFDMESPKSQPMLQERHKVEPTSSNHGAENDDQYVLVHQGRQKGLSSALENQQEVATEALDAFTEKNNKSEDVQEPNTRANMTHENIETSVSIENLPTTNIGTGDEKESNIQEVTSEGNRSVTVPQEDQVATTSSNKDGVTEVVTQGGNSTNSEIEHYKPGDVLETEKSGIQSNLTENSTYSQHESKTNGTFGLQDINTGRGIVHGNISKAERNVSVVAGAAITDDGVSETVWVPGPTADPTNPTIVEETIQSSLEPTGGYLNNTDFTSTDKQTHLSSTTVLTTRYEESVNYNPNFEQTTPISDDVERYLENPIDHDQVLVTTKKVTNVTEIDESNEPEVLNTTSTITTAVSYTTPNLITQTSTKTPEKTFSSTSVPSLSTYTTEDISSNITNPLEQEESTTLSTTLESDVGTVHEEPEHFTLISFSSEKPTTSASSNAFSTASHTHEDQDNTTAGVIVPVEEKTNTEEPEIPNKTATPLQVIPKLTSAETRLPETYTTEHNNLHVFDSLPSTSPSSLGVSNETVTTNKTCNSANPCLNDEICVHQIEGCVCVKTVNNLKTERLCQDFITTTAAPSTTLSSTTNSKNPTNNSKEPGDLNSNTFSVKKFENLSASEKSNKTVSVAFIPAPEVIEWFQHYDWKFRTFVSSAVETCMHRITTNKTGTTCKASPTQIVYLSPTPTKDNGTIIVSFLVEYTTKKDNISFIDSKLVQKCVKDFQRNIESELGLKITSLSGEYPSHLAERCNSSIPGLTQRQVKYLLIGISVSLIILVFALVFFTLWCRRTRLDFHPNIATYRHTFVSPRSPGDGRHLATDEQCKQGELRWRDPAKVHLQKIEDSDGYVVSMEEMEMAQHEQDENNATSSSGYRNRNETTIKE